jgi:hypothetical protein
VVLRSAHDSGVAFIGGRWIIERDGMNLFQVILYSASQRRIRQYDDRPGKRTQRRSRLGPTTNLGHKGELKL